MPAAVPELAWLQAGLDEFLEPAAILAGYKKAAIPEGGAWLVPDVRYLLDLRAVPRSQVVVHCLAVAHYPAADHSLAVRREPDGFPAAADEKQPDSGDGHC